MNSPQPLGRQDRSGFACGAPSLDRYLKEQAGQDVRNRVAAVFVLEDGGQVIGYYTLSATAIAPTALPETVRRRLPRYERLPAILLGRLAVDQRRRGEGLGGFLLIDALRRALRLQEELGAIAVVVDALNNTARQFYEHYQFAPLLDDPNHLYLSTRVIGRVLAEAGVSP